MHRLCRLPLPAVAISLLGAAVLGPAARAQNLALDKRGGAVGDVVSFDVLGLPSEPYIVLFDFVEQTTPVPALGITLMIPDRWAASSYTLPGFFAATDAQGRATASLQLPNESWLESFVFSLQAVAGSGPFRVSNLVRLTPQQRGTFVPTLNAPALPMLAGGVVAEGDGNFLFVGGSGPVAQRYSERVEEWQTAGATFGVGLLSQSTGLLDGRVLFTGGIDPATGQPTAAAAIYDPATQTTTTLAMATARAGHGASLLGNGKVLITGGSNTFDLMNPLSLFTGLLNSTELFDPATGTFGPGPNMLEPRAMHTSTTLSTGEVLVAGGLSLLPIVNIPNVSSTAYRYNPSSNSFGLPALFSGGRLLHSAAALDNGKVLLVGGVELDLTTFLQTGNIADIALGTRTDCQLYTPGFLGSGSFATVSGLQQGRAGAAVAPLPGGRALIAGGFELTIDIPNMQFGLQPLASADLFASNPNAIAPTGSMASPRAFPLAVNLPDGTVLLTGGGLGSAEIYQ
ncbi:MAG: hypothetical protein KDE27_13740 [Planctomycetes bacterium]|nr:hypothetical protein [Planctomycetota bacterium]